MHRRSGRLADEQGFGPRADDRAAAEPTPKRVRARLGDRWILDSDRALIAWIEGPTPDFAIPFADVQAKLELGPERDHECLGRVQDVTIAGPERVEGAGVRVRQAPSHVQRLRDHVILDWGVPDEWYVEDERQRGHPRDPYHRIDVHETSRQVRIEVGGETVAESDRSLALFETGLPFRFYLSRVDVRTDLLEPSETETVCAYKGQATYYDVVAGDERVEDAAWSYLQPEPAFGRLQERIAFHQEKVGMQVAATELA